MVQVNSVKYYYSEEACSTPTFSVTSESELTKNSTVTITSATTGSTIYYTTDGSTPTTSSAHGTAGEASATVTVSDDMTIKAIAVKDGNSNSEVATATYTVKKAANTITVTDGTTKNIALTGAGAIEDGMYDLSDLVSSTEGTVNYEITSTQNLVEGTDFEFADGLFEFKTTYKGQIVVTASSPATADYSAATPVDITINVSGDLRTPVFSFSDTEQLAKNSTLTVGSDNVTTDGTITVTTADATVASVATNVITGVKVGSTSITVSAAEGTYYAAGSKTFTLNVIAVKGSLENPYTVAEAIAATPSSGTSDEVYIHGYVKNFYGSNTTITGDATYHRYYINDGGTSTTLLVFSGKGLNNVAFSSASDLLVDDEVIIYGGLTTYNSTKEVAADNYIYSLKRKADSDLTVTSATPVALTMTTANIAPTSTITWTTSSTGDIICTSSDNAVATVTDAGVITAAGPGTATITIYQDADADNKEGETTVTVTVTDSRDYVATGIDLPSEQKTLTKGDIDDFAATSTKAAAFTGTITYSYVSADASIVDVDGSTFSAKGAGTTTVTITATPTGGNAADYKANSQEVDIIVNGTNSISLSGTTVNEPFSAETFDITATVPTDNYDGTVTAESSNTAVATVSVDGTTITVTPVAVGSATITVTAGTGTYYPATAQATRDVTFTQPTGGETAKTSPSTLLFGESFGNNSSNARDWNDSYSVKSGVESVYSGITEYTVSNVKQGKNTTGSTGSGLNQSSQGTDASIIIGPLNVEGYKNLSLKYQWKAGSIKGTYTTSASYATSSTGEYTSLTGTGDGASTFVERSYSLPAAAQVSTLFLKIVWNTSNTQAIIDELQLYGQEAAVVPVTLNSAGYATFCSEYPLDFSTAEDVTAWQVTSTTGGTVTFGQVTGSIKGGTGILLKGEAGATVNIPSVNSTNTLSENMFVGTLAPYYLSETSDATYTYFGLKGNEFVMINPGTIAAHKAFLPVPNGDVPAEGKLNIVFNDETAIRTIASGSTSDAWYDLQGRRVMNPTKGLYIHNGKKVVVK